MENKPMTEYGPISEIEKVIVENIQDTFDRQEAFQLILKFCDDYTKHHLKQFAEECKVKQFEVDNFNDAVLIEDIDQTLTDYLNKL